MPSNIDGNTDLLEIFKMMSMMQQFQNDDKGLEAAWQKIASMAPEERAEALRIMGQDYKGKREGLASDIAYSEKKAATPMPRGGTAGPASNPFAVHVAGNPLEYIAAGMDRFQGEKGRRKARADWDKTVDDKTKATALTQGALVDDVQSVMPGQLRGGMRTGPDGRPMTEEEWLAYQKQLQQGGWTGGA